MAGDRAGEAFRIDFDLHWRRWALVVVDGVGHGDIVEEGRRLVDRIGNRGHRNLATGI